VVAFVRGLPEWTGRLTESTFIVLAPSFDAYVAMLHIDRSDIIDRLEHNDYGVPSDIDDIEKHLDIGMRQWREHAELVTRLQ
jgi:hypothetical protein